MRRIIGLLVAGSMAAAGLLAIVGIPSFAGGSGASVAAAATPAQQIGMKVLLITNTTDDTTAGGIAYADWVNTLQREGVAYNSWVTTGGSPMPTLSSTAADGTQVANYEGVVVATSGTEGLTPDQWTTLQTFEHQFSVRQVTAYAVPSSDYGLTAANPVGSFAGNTEAPTLTSAGSAVFPYLKKIDFDAGTFGYQGTAGANDQTLISGNDGSSLLGIYTATDGRQTMYQTFNENQYMLQSELLRHGELDWLGRNTYFGDQRNYMETHIDDNFLSDDSYTPGAGGVVGGGATDYNAADALREQPADVTKAADWSKTNNFRIDMLYNGGGSTGSGDPLLTAFKAAKNDFGWVNHTWDHPNLDQGCATQQYIQDEITKNTTFATGTLGLTASADPTKSLGVENPGELVTGEHSGLANLVPGNPGTVDPPEFNAVTTNPTGGTFTAGSYTYGITDQFSTTGGESTASQAAASAAVVANGSVTIQWDATCHAAQYKLYREVTGSNAWFLITTVPAATTDFGDTGASELSFTDTGAAGTSATLPTTNNASETPYEQNTALTAAFGAPGIGITDFGSDASKPYPNPATATFTTGSPPATQYPVGATFPDGAATAIPRYPTNIYYNAATNAQEVNEYETLYDSPTCKPVTGVTTCNGVGTVFTINDIVNSIDFGNPGMFSHLMGNDPRPHYFHQTNMMSQTTGGATAQGDGLYYEVMNPLLAQYNAYFASNSPVEQLTMQAIGTLLKEQAAWGTAAGSQVTGSIEGNVVTINNNGAAIQIPLTGMADVGTPYAGTVSGWTNAPSGTSTHKALAAWPALPTTPVVVAVPTGPAPGAGTGAKVINKAPTPIVPPGGSTVPKTKVVTKAKPIAYVAVQVKPKTVSIKHGKVTVSLQCRATKGKTGKNKLCAGKFTLKVAGHKLNHRFRFRSSKTHRFTVKLSTKVMSAAARANRHHHHRMTGSLLISTTQSHAKSRSTRGKLTIRI